MSPHRSARLAGRPNKAKPGAHLTRTPTPSSAAANSRRRMHAAATHPFPLVHFPPPTTPPINTHRGSKATEPATDHPGTRPLFALLLRSCRASIAMETVPMMTMRMASASPAPTYRPLGGRRPNRAAFPRARHGGCRDLRATVLGRFFGGGDHGNKNHEVGSCTFADDRSLVPDDQSFARKSQCHG